MDKTGLTVSKEFMERLKREYERRKIELHMRGITSITKWVIAIMDEWLEKNPPRFKILNHDHNLVRVHDRAENLVAEVIFSLPDKSYCSACKKPLCVHVMYALSQPDVIEELRKRGWSGEDYLD